MGALSSLNLADNCIGLAAGWKPSAKHKGWFDGPNDEFEQKPPLDMSGIITLAGAIRDMRALTRLDISNCSLAAEGGKALAAGLKGNQGLIKLNLAGNALGVLADRSDYDISGVIAIADAIPDMGALSVLSLKSNNLRAAGCKTLAKGLKGNQVITELNIADNNLANSGSDMSGVIALADAIPDMGAMTSLNLASNSLYDEGAKVVAASLPKCT
jgi:hypothetical protein